MTDTVRRRCIRPTCRRWFPLTAPDLKFCPECRRLLLARENTGEKERNTAAMAELDFYLSVENKEREQWDTRIIDETGREVWALELARRYLAETRPRPL